MKKVFLNLVILLASLSSLANSQGKNDECFALSLDGKKISHIVVYSSDYDNQAEDGPVPTFNVRVSDYISNLITGSTLDEKIINTWESKPIYGKPHPAKHHVAFSQTKLNGQKVSYDVTLEGIAKDIGGGVTILSGRSEVLIDGKRTSMPSLKTIRGCLDTSDRKDFEYVESNL